MKKILKMMFVLAFLLVQIVPTTLVNAESGTNNNNGTITINNVEEGRVYTIYEILQLESYDTTKNAYAYKATTEWSEFVNSDAVKGVYLNVDTQGYVTWLTNADVAAFAKLALQYAKDNNSTITTKTSIEASSSNIQNKTVDGKVVKYIEFTGLNLGYYLVDSSLGTICGLTTTKPSATIEEKNTVPTVDKKVKEDSGDYGKSNTAQIGQEVEFQTTIKIGEGAINYTLHDKMSAGLTFKEIVEVKKVDAKNNETILNPTSDYTVKTTELTDRCTFEISFNNNLITSLKTSDKLVVTYKAILNKDAVVEGNGNPNETYVKYGDNGDLETEHDTTKTYTYDFQIVKTNSEHKYLEGAEFDLYTTESGGNKIPLIALNDENGYKVYRVATDEEINNGFVSAKIQAGKVIIKGLDLDKYYLEETKAPNGYNQLPARVAFTVSGTTADDVSVVGEIYQTPNHGLVVVNNTGNELPSTGGIGTMLFVLIGSMMVIGCGVLLVTKLRMTKMSD